jgi:NADPH:quinone reductase
MKAAMFDDLGKPEDIVIRDIGVPHPAAGQVLLRVQAAGVNPIDWKVATGVRKQVFPISFPWTPGWDVAGEVVEAGPGVQAWQPGDAVVAFTNAPAPGQRRNGCYAEYVAVDENLLVRRPDSLDPVQAAAIPLAALTAWQALMDTAGLKTGETVYIRGGAGGVGSYAVQFAHRVGARVISTASAPKHDYLRALGVDVVLDYQREDIVAAVREAAGGAGVDVLFDCVGTTDCDAHAPALRPGGRIVTIAGDVSEAVQAEVGAAGYNRIVLSANAAELADIVAWLAAGELRLPSIETLPLERAGEALARSKAGRVRGKLVLVPGQSG